MDDVFINRHCMYYLYNIILAEVGCR